MTVQTQAERARGRAAAQEFARLPQLVGLHWFQYYDHPLEAVLMITRITTLAWWTCMTVRTRN